ncbi:mitochondrial carrier protein [Babesia ovata]|uniref:Mitochondrial carrier protein n=1 Tax=Babesia ovata TaxID=189622 RepID=A0A2H6KEQ2_9APIC|nr:mitochondrial carrier protein [Babesia ovata]GBE61480.1 mitochondrial carrier protein [Babesia ovata]
MEAPTLATFSRAPLLEVGVILEESRRSGLVVSSLCVPTDVVRNYWYFNPELKGIRGSISTVGVARHIYATRGIRCFFTGFHLTALNVVGGQTIFLLSYDALKTEMSTPLASILGRMATLLSMQPLECLRTYTQANLPGRTMSFFKDTKGLAAIKSLYRGLIPTVIRDVPFSAVHWPLNDLLYRRFIASCGRSESDLSKGQKFALSFATGTMSSMLATMISQPFDIVKTTIQVRLYLHIFAWYICFETALWKQFLFLAIMGVVGIR